MPAQCKFDSAGHYMGQGALHGAPVAEDSAKRKPSTKNIAFKSLLNFGTSACESEASTTASGQVTPVYYFSEEEFHPSLNAKDSGLASQPLQECSPDLWASPDNEQLNQLPRLNLPEFLPEEVICCELEQRLSSTLSQLRCRRGMPQLAVSTEQVRSRRKSGIYRV